MAKKRLVVVCPGRGSYTKETLGYLKNASHVRDFIADMDERRRALGILGRALYECRRYALERKTFGVAIAQHQSVQNMLADAATQLDAAGLLTLRAAYMKEKGLPFSARAAMAKLYASEMAGRVCDMAIQVHGGYGYTQEFPVERFMRDARVQRIYEGTSEVQRMVIARSLLKEFADHV